MGSETAQIKEKDYWQTFQQYCKNIVFKDFGKKGNIAKNIFLFFQNNNPFSCNHKQ